MQQWEQSQGYLEISRADLLYNAQTVVRYVDCPVIGVVKCDGYGVSITEAAAAWRAAGVKLFAVSEPEEALTLRRAGFYEDILLLSPVASSGLLNALIRANVILTVTGAACARFYVQSCEAPVRVHVAVDTGMGRFGVRWTGLDELERIYRTEGLQCEGIFSHFAASFQKNGKETRLQLERFLSTAQALTERGVDVGMRHIANSCAALRFPESRLDAVRIGSALVGRLPVSVPVQLRPVGVFKAQVVDCKLLHKGDYTGYASLCRLRRDTSVAIIALGHQSGFGLTKIPQTFRLRDLVRHTVHLLRTFRKAPMVYYQGRALPVVGRIGTQFTLIDAGGTDLAPGSYVSANVDIMLPPPHRRYV